MTHHAATLRVYAVRRSDGTLHYLVNGRDRHAGRVAIFARDRVRAEISPGRVRRGGTVLGPGERGRACGRGYSGPPPSRWRLPPTGSTAGPNVSAGPNGTSGPSPEGNRSGFSASRPT